MAGSSTQASTPEMALSHAEMDEIQAQVRNFASRSSSEDFELRLTPVPKNGQTQQQSDTNRQHLDVVKLQVEVDELERMVTLQRQQNKLLQSWQDYHDTQGKLEEEDIMKAKIQGLKQMVSTVRQITGVIITSAKTRVIKQGTLWVDKEKVIEGTCGDVEFMLDMKLHEAMREDQIIEAKITHLSISTSENIYADLGSTIERLSEEGNAQGFLSLLPSYKKWQTARTQTFAHFTNKYPEIATLKSPATLVMSHPVKKCKFLVDWQLGVSDVNTVIPELELSVQVPAKVQTSSVIKTAPESFQLMLKDLGIEAAMETLVSLIQS